MEPAELEKGATKLNDILLTAFEMASKLIPILPLRKDDWYTDELRDKKKIVNKLQNSGPRDKYLRARQDYQRNKRKAEKQAYREYTEKLNETKDIARLQKCLESGPKQMLSSLKKEDGNYTRDLKETLTYLMQTHFPGCEIITEEQSFENLLNKGRRRTKKEILEILECTTIEKILWAIESFSPYKAPGEDDIFPAILKKSKNLVAPILQKLYRSS